MELEDGSTMKFIIILSVYKAFYHLRANFKDDFFKDFKKIKSPISTLSLGFLRERFSKN